jgi:hypothetical protein
VEKEEMRRWGKRRTGPGRYYLAPGTCEAISDLREKGLTFEEAIEEILSGRQHGKVETDPDGIDAAGKRYSWDLVKGGRDLS